jgi:hypothetical protein
MAGMVFGCEDMTAFDLLNPSITPTTEKQGEGMRLPSKGPVKSGHFRTLASGDPNGDGIPELLSANLLSGDLVIWPGLRKSGWGKPYTLPVGSEISAIALADMDADARLDIIASFRRNGSSGIDIWKNMGNLNFRRTAGPGKGEFFDDVHAADLNFDGRADLIAVKGAPSPKGSLRIWMNLGPENGNRRPPLKRAANFTA